MGMAVKLQSETNPIVTLLWLLVISFATFIVMYMGVPGTGFNGLRAGVFFDMETGFEDARFMDNRIVCDSKEALHNIQAELLKIKPDYPIERVTLHFDNYAAGYKYQVRYVTYYAQAISFGGEGRFFRRGAQVGDLDLDKEVKAKDEALEKAIRGTLERYFKSKGAQ
jgi:hypothetical protein